MSAKDIYHEGFKNALIKDGWEIIRDPYQILLVIININEEKIIKWTN